MEQVIDTDAGHKLNSNFTECNPFACECDLVWTSIEQRTNSRVHIVSFLGYLTSQSTQSWLIHTCLTRLHVF